MATAPPHITLYLPEYEMDLGEKHNTSYTFLSDTRITNV